MAQAAIWAGVMGPRTQHCASPCWASLQTNTQRMQGKEAGIPKNPFHQNTVCKLLCPDLHAVGSGMRHVAVYDCTT